MIMIIIIIIIIITIINITIVNNVLGRQCLPDVHCAGGAADLSIGNEAAMHPT